MEKEHEERRKFRFAAIMIVSTILAGFSLFAVDQWGEAEKQSQIALARQIAAEAELLQDQDQHPDLIVLRVVLGLEAFKLESSHSSQSDVNLNGSVPDLYEALALLPPYPPAPIDINQNRVEAMAFSPDGEYIATASAQGMTRIWKFTKGKPNAKFSLNEENVLAIAFSPDGKYVATASADRTAQLWETTSTQPFGKTLTHNDNINAIAFSPDREHLATASADGVTQISKIIDDNITHSSIELPSHKESVLAIAFSPDGKYLATASADNTAQVWEVNSGNLAGPPLKHAGDVNTIIFSPDGNSITTGSDDKTARIWKINSGEETTRMLHESPVVSLAFVSSDLNQEEPYLATVGFDRNAQVWKITERAVVQLKLDSSRDIAISPSGQCVAVANQDDVQLWRTTSRELSGTSLGISNSVDAIAFSPYGRYIAAARENIIYLREIKDSDPQCNFREDGDTLELATGRDIVEIALSPEPYLAIVDLDNVVRILKRRDDTLECLGEVEFNSPVTAIKFEQNKNQLEITSYRGKQFQRTYRQKRIGVPG